jgi:flavin-dependent dehydrogenase
VSSKAEYDLAIVGCGFAGLIAAATAASRGLSVVVLESKPRSGARVHTTGTLVKEAAEELAFPVHLTRKIRGVRLYSPNLKAVDLLASGYYFLSTDTGALLDWLSSRASYAGARVLNATRFTDARVRNDRVEIEPLGLTARFVIGADGARSKVARSLALGINRHFLVGVEAEFPTGQTKAAELLPCFLNSRFAPGYLGWAVPGVGVWQVCLAVRHGRIPDLDAFMPKVAPMLGLDLHTVKERRAGIIPCGGTVRPFASRYALLVGDAAGLVSPLTGGGIHCAFHYGRRAALAVCDYLCDGAEHPGAVMARQYPSFFGKRLARIAMNGEPPNALYNMILTSPAFLSLARAIYFHRRGIAVEAFPEAAEDAR